MTGRGGGFRPGTGAAARAFEERTGIKAPRIIAWEVTRSCNLACAHCRAAARREPYPGELSLDECRRVIADIASITDPILILTGGEPLMRPDIWDIIDCAREAGLHPVIGTNGTLVDDECAAKIAAHGIGRVSVSLDFPDEERQDAFRGQPGAFRRAIEGIRNLRAHGVGVQVNTTVTRMNRDLMEEMHGLAESEGASAFHPFLLVPTGRGSDLLDEELSADEYEEVLAWACRRQRTSPLHFKPTDAPQYYRIIRQLAAEEGREVTPETYGMEALTRGCLGGITFAFIGHTGDVQPCGYFDMRLGNVREIPFPRIWETSPVLDDLRHYDRLRGKCGACEYKGVCGGCRARALAATGDYLAQEPYCAHAPRAWARQRVLDEIQSGFPLEHDPYDALADRLGLGRRQVLDAVAELRADGSVRSIGASLSSRHLGYASSLCALKVPGGEEEAERAAAVVNAYPEVTHNYLRDAEFNVWFTVIAPSMAEIEALLEEVGRATGCAGAINLPVETLYKIRVDFSGRAPEAPGGDGNGPGAPFDPQDPFDVALARWAQGDAAGELPYEDAAAFVAGETGDPSVDEGRVIARLKEWKAGGVVRRFGAFVRHRKLGYSHNAMVVFDAAPDQADRIGRAFSEFPFVSHCYRRTRRAQWPYNLYAVVHAKSADELASHVDELRRAGGIEPRVLSSLKEYKKTLPRYFAK